jgi:uncharacterized SAM-binding protein YcdF (DUF218 family)
MYTKEKSKARRLRETTFYKFFVRPILFIILTGLIIAGGILYCIFDNANGSKPVKSDAMIILGCQIKGDIPSLMLEYRLKKALELYNKGYSDYIIVSGGQGKDEDYTEAYIMKRWLQRKGVDGNRIIEEEKSTSTFENLKFSKKVMDNKNLKTAIIVSNDFHMFRSLKLAERLNIKASGAPSPTVEYLKFYYYSREILSVLKSFILDR